MRDAIGGAGYTLMLAPRCKTCDLQVERAFCDLLCLMTTVYVTVLWRSISETRDVLVYEVYRKRPFGIDFFPSWLSSHTCAAERTAMLRIRLAATGEDVVALDASEFEAVVEQHGSTVASLKHYLAQRHFPKRFSRFQLRILGEGSSSEMEDEESITPPLDLQLILMNHLPPDEERDAGFVQSCRAGRVDEVVENLKAPQNPNVVSGGAAALTRAAAHGQQEVVRLLLEAGADAKWKDTFQRTALHVAAQCNRSEVVRILLEFGADMEAVDRYGLRPLHRAAQHDCLDVVKLLVEAGVDTNALDKGGRTAAQLVTQKGSIAAAQLLQDDKRRVLKSQAEIAWSLR